MASRFDDEDIEIIMTLARDLTGTKVTRADHGVIIQNVATRLSETKSHNLEEYLTLVDENDAEMPFLLSAVTIHTTSWFRESAAFEKLAQFVDARIKSNSRSPLKVLSVACSTGEEVYSIAAVLEGFRISNPSFEYSIEGWDIDPISLRTAREASYDVLQLEALTEKHRLQLALISESHEKRFGINEKVRDRCRFKTVNIVQPPSDKSVYDYVICRNMLIYFAPEDAKAIVQHLLSRVAPSGLFCTGVSETIAVTSKAVTPIGGATYRAGPTVSASSSSKRAVGVINCMKESHFRVLLAEDEPELRALMMESLSEAGYEVAAAANAREGLKLLDSGDFGLVISDFRMPGKDGVEFCREARSVGYKAAFVIVSGGADRRMAEEGLKAGCNEVILKPLISDDLVRMVRSYIGTPTANVASSPTLILLGASTGGTEVLAKLLTDMPRDCPPVMLVQHITAGFAYDFAARISRVSGLKRR